MKRHINRDKCTTLSFLILIYINSLIEVIHNVFFANYFAFFEIQNNRNKSQQSIILSQHLLIFKHNSHFRAQQKHPSLLIFQNSQKIRFFESRCLIRRNSCIHNQHYKILKQKAMECEIVQLQDNEYDDGEAPLSLMKNLSNTLPFRFIDDLNRKASQLSNSTNHSSWKNIKQCFTEKAKNRESFQAELRLDFTQDDSDSSQALDGGKIIGGTCPVQRLSGRKRVSIQKKRSPAYPLEGDGFTKLPDGRVVFGIWNNGTLTSKAKIMYPSADVYIGDVKDYNRHGTGVLTLKNGQKYVGSFKNGKCEGFGTKYDQEGKICCEGIWKGGILVKRIY